MANDAQLAARVKPLVSCLMLTLAVPGRFAFACESIAAYCAQSYTPCELVLVVNGGTAEGRRRLHDHVQGLARADIRVVEVLGGQTLGALRNISREHAAGEITCQWDDDDLHHPERVEQQVQALLDGGYEAVLLRDVWQFFPQARQLYWTHWGAAPAGGHPGTLTARASAAIRYSADGPSARLGEDLEVALELRAQSKLGFVTGLPHLFVYVSHGENSWNMEHHRRLVEELAISPGLLRRREAEIRKGLQPFAFARGPVQVVGNTGPAFLA